MSSGSRVSRSSRGHPVQGDVLPSTGQEFLSWLDDKQLELRDAMDMSDVESASAITGLITRGLAKMASFIPPPIHTVEHGGMKRVIARYGLRGTRVGEASHPGPSSSSLSRGFESDLGLEVVENHWFRLLQERPSQCAGHCLLETTVSPKLRPTIGTYAPVWATAQLEPRLCLMPFRRAEQLAVGTCSTDRSVKSSTLTLMTSNLRVSVLQQTWWKAWGVIFVSSASALPLARSDHTGLANPASSKLA